MRHYLIDVALKSNQKARFEKRHLLVAISAHVARDGSDDTDRVEAAAKVYMIIKVRAGAVTTMPKLPYFLKHDANNPLPQHKPAMRPGLGGEVRNEKDKKRGGEGQDGKL